MAKDQYALLIEIDGFHAFSNMPHPTDELNQFLLDDWTVAHIQPFGKRDDKLYALVIIEKESIYK